MSLRRRAIVSALWHVGAGVGGRLVGVLGTLALTWFLVPDVVGQVGVASILVFSTRLLVSLGLGAFVAAHPGADRGIVFHATVLNLLLTTIAAALALVAGGPLGRLLGADASPDLVPGLVAAMAIGALADLPERILVRDLRFRTLGLSTAGAEITYTAAAVGLAAAGFGAMAIVWANVARAVFRLGLVFVVVDWRLWLTPAKLSLARFRTIVRFGLPVQIGTLASQAAHRWDNLLIARLFGPGPMASYNFAYNLASIPADTIGDSVADVLLPSFAQLSPDRRRLAFSRAAALLSLVIFPLAVGLGAVSETLVGTLFHPRWHGVAPLLTVLAALSIVHPIADIVRSYYQAADRTGASMLLQIGHAVAGLGFIWVFGRFGITWAALGATAAAVLYALVGLAYLGAVEGVHAGAVLLAYARPLLPCAVMAGAVLGTRAGLGGLGLGVGPVRLGAEVLAGAIAYVAAALVLVRGPARDVLALVRDAVARRRGGAAQGA